MRTEVLTAARGHTDDGAGRAHGGDGRVEDQRGAELGGHRLGQGRVAACHAHGLRLAVEHPRGHRGLLRDEEHRQVGELRVVERDVRLLGDEPRFGNEAERVEPRGEGHAIERTGVVGRLGVLGIHAVLLGEAQELVVDAEVVGEHLAAAQRGQLRERVGAPPVPEPPHPGPAGRVARAQLGVETDTAHHRAQRRVRVVDRLTAGFRSQPAIELDAVDASVERVDAAADARPRLEHHHVPARVAERERGGEPREPRAHDHHSAGSARIGPVGDARCRLRRTHEGLTLRGSAMLTLVRYRRMPIEVESPEQLGYDTITNNLSESSVADRRLADLGLTVGPGAGLDELLLCYGDHLGDPGLREAVAEGGDGLRADDVLVTPGAAAALFATATSLLEPGDHAVVVRTNYATNLETPRAIGASLDVVDVQFDDAWQLDVERLASRVQPGITKLISVTCPHNPTGTMLALASLHALVELAERSGAVLLVDETYRDLTHGSPLPVAATLSPR